MKKFLLAVALFLAAGSSLWALEAILDTGYYNTYYRSYKCKSKANSLGSARITGTSPLGFYADGTFLPGNQNDSLLSFGVGLATGIDFGNCIKKDGEKFPGTPTIGGYLGIGPAMRFKPIEKLTFTLRPAIIGSILGCEETSIEWSLINVPYTVEKTFMTYVCSLETNLCCAFWITKSFGLNCGATCSIPLTGKAQIQRNVDGRKVSSCNNVIYRGFTGKFFVGASFAWTK